MSARTKRSHVETFSSNKKVKGKAIESDEDDDKENRSDVETELEEDISQQGEESEESEEEEEEEESEEEEEESEEEEEEDDEAENSVQNQTLAQQEITGKWNESIVVAYVSRVYQNSNILKQVRLDLFNEIKLWHEEYKRDYDVEIIPSKHINPKQHRTLDVVDNKIRYISTMVKRIASNAEEIANDFEKIDANISQEEYYKLYKSAFGANDVKMHVKVFNNACKRPISSAKGKIQPPIASAFATEIKFILSCLPYLVRKHHWTLPQGTLGSNERKAWKAQNENKVRNNVKKIAYGTLFLSFLERCGDVVDDLKRTKANRAIARLEKKVARLFKQYSEAKAELDKEKNKNKKVT